MANVSVTGLPANWKPGDPITTTATTDQNPYTSALIATASAQAEAKRNLDAAQTAVTAYPDNSLYQTQLQINQQQYAATQQAYNTAQTNFKSANAPIAKLNAEGTDTGTNGTVRTVGETQATPANPLNITNDDNGSAWAPNTQGVGAGTGQSRGDENPGSNSQTRQLLSQTYGNGTQNTTIIAQPNVLDQYASYTYALSWYLLSPTQYNTAVLTEAFNTTGWQLLMQSGGAPITGRNQYFPEDFYMDDLEIDSNIPLGGTGLPYSAMSLRWKVMEPNGITLIQKLADAVHTLYKNSTPASTSSVSEWDDNTTMLPGHQRSGSQVNANQTNQVARFLAAQHCMVIRFYGYDANGNLVAPATGQYTTTGQLGGPNQAVITKYYPFIIENITYRVNKSQIEYTISALPVPHFYNTSTDRGTIPFGFALTGQTVGQLLSGATVPGVNSDPNARTSSSNLPSSSNAQQVTVQPDDATTSALFNDGTGYAPGYDPNAGWSA